MSVAFFCACWSPQLPSGFERVARWPKKCTRQPSPGNQGESFWPHTWPAPPRPQTARTPGRTPLSVHARPQHVKSVNRSNAGGMPDMFCHRVCTAAVISVVSIAQHSPNIIHCSPPATLPPLSSSSSSRSCSAAVALLQLSRARTVLLLVTSSPSTAAAATASAAVASVLASSSRSASLLRLLCCSCTCQSAPQQAFRGHGCTLHSA